MARPADKEPRFPCVPRVMYADVAMCRMQYVASGIFDGVVSESNQRWLDQLTRSHASHVFHKSDFIGERLIRPSFYVKKP